MSTSRVCPRLWWKFPSKFFLLPSTNDMRGNGALQQETLKWLWLTMQATIDNVRAQFVRSTTSSSVNFFLKYTPSFLMFALFTSTDFHQTGTRCVIERIIYKLSIVCESKFELAKTNQSGWQSQQLRRCKCQTSLPGNLERLALCGLDRKNGSYD